MLVESLATVGYEQLTKSGEFLVTGFAKFHVIKKPATNPTDFELAHTFRLRRR